MPSCDADSHECSKEQHWSGNVSCAAQHTAQRQQIRSSVAKGQKTSTIAVTALQIRRDASTDRRYLRGEQADLAAHGVRLLLRRRLRTQPADTQPDSTQRSEGKGRTGWKQGARTDTRPHGTNDRLLTYCAKQAYKGPNLEHFGQRLARVRNHLDRLLHHKDEVKGENNERPSVSARTELG